MTQDDAGLTNPEMLKGLTAYDRNGEKIGSVERVYLDAHSGHAGWVTVKTGLFGTKESFVPLDGARLQQDALHVMATKEAVKGASTADVGQGLEPTLEHQLYAHYGLDSTAEATRGTAGNLDTASVRSTWSADEQTARETEGIVGAAGAGQGHEAREFATRSGPAADSEAHEMVRSEERLHVGTREEEVGHARLRKVVVTEDVTRSVPVSHEEVRVVREPIAEGEDVNADIGDAQTEVTLHAEKPVVRKEAVAVERVRLEVEKVTETEEVSDTVRKERVEFDDAKADDGGMGKAWRDRKQGPRH
ncbi:DUF2382 domain-containing protein [Streptomyces sp. BA2]|uniref:DUF2382 domain-containing protein n=1 Tax=Streptomyces sp. BA2 TaxID=436595 RepID=UPI00132396E0|nr:PRC and DUF2382 domain-containing protein [Streptomyces sp. BA2]MWA07792.1 DUF2382 domain-containing protein [Streptomyces sp. BA2]